MLKNLQQFSTFPGSVKKGIGFLFAGWVLFYVFLFYFIEGQDFPLRVKVVGILCFLTILTLKNWSRVICLLCNVMILLQFGFVFAGFAVSGKPVLAAVTGAMLLMFIVASYYLLKKETVQFFKQTKETEPANP